MIQAIWIGLSVLSTFCLSGDAGYLKHSVLQDLPGLQDPPIRQVEKKENGQRLIAPLGKIDAWSTKSDQTELLQKQKEGFYFGQPSGSALPIIAVDAGKRFQSVDGFGYTLTGGSAQLIRRLEPRQRKALLQELFGKEDASLAISYLRISIGASDLNESVFSYDDLPAGSEDLALKHFNLSADTLDLIPLLQEILSIHPRLKILGSPWSPPTWMKSNQNSVGGYLLDKYRDVYARYFVRYIRAMAAKGNKIDAITIQNEPEHGGNNPSMLMNAVQQNEFIKSYLGPVFQKEGIPTKIIIWDHNCDHPEYPISILNDPMTRKFVNGTAFHLYKGTEAALSEVHAKHPDKAVYFTEQWTGSKSDFAGDLKWHTKHVIIGTLRNWSRIALEWNLANDPQFNPHTPGGCTECKGALTIADHGGFNRNVSYYIIAQVSKFVPPGSVRIESSEVDGLSTIAFIRPDQKKVLLVLNEADADKKFTIQFRQQEATCRIGGNAVTTFIWN